MMNRFFKSLSICLTILSLCGIFFLSQEQAFAIIYDMAYTSQGFEPQRLTVLRNSTLTITNQSSVPLDLFSANFSSHINKSKFNTGTLDAGKSFSVTLTDFGEHIIQNRQQRSHYGYITVIEKPFPISSAIPFSSSQAAELGPITSRAGQSDQLNGATTSAFQLKEKLQPTIEKSDISIATKSIQDSVPDLEQAQNSANYTYIIQLIVLASLIFTSIALTIYILGPVMLTHLQKIRTKKSS